MSVTEYRAGFVLHPELTSMTLLKQAVAAGMAVKVEPVNAVHLCDEVCIVKLFKDRLVTPRGAKCSILSRKTVAIFRAHVNAAGFITRVLGPKDCPACAASGQHPSGERIPYGSGSEPMPCDECGGKGRL